MFLTQETVANEQEDLRELTVRNLSHPSSLSLQAFIPFLLNYVKKRTNPYANLTLDLIC